MTDIRNHVAHIMETMIIVSVACFAMRHCNSDADYVRRMDVLNAKIDENRNDAKRLRMHHKDLIADSVQNNPLCRQLFRALVLRDSLAAMNDTLMKKAYNSARGLSQITIPAKDESLFNQYKYHYGINRMGVQYRANTTQIAECDSLISKYQTLPDDIARYFDSLVFARTQKYADEMDSLLDCKMTLIEARNR